MKVKSIEFNGYEDVYNMEVANHHNFAVNGGFIVHNCDAIRGFVSGRPYPTITLSNGKSTLPWFFRSNNKSNENNIVEW